MPKNEDLFTRTVEMLKQWEADKGQGGGVPASPQDIRSDIEEAIVEYLGEDDNKQAA